MQIHPSLCELENTITDATVADVAYLQHRIRELEKQLQRTQAEAERFRLDCDRYYKLVQQINSVILTLNPNGAVLFVNDFGLDLFGFDHDELIGRNIIGTLIPNLADGSGRYLPEMICRLLDSPDEFLVNENDNVTRDGRRVRIHWSNRALRDDNGQLIEIHSVGSVVEPTDCGNS